MSLDDASDVDDVFLLAVRQGKRKSICRFILASVRRRDLVMVRFAFPVWSTRQVCSPWDEGCAESAWGAQVISERGGLAEPSVAYKYYSFTIAATNNKQ